VRWPNGVRLAGIALAIVAIQAAAVLAYVRVERGRRLIAEPAFDYEGLTGIAPELTLVRPDGADHRLSGLRGKTLLLHFWATWCPPCREELPGLLVTGRELARGGQFEVVAVSLDENWESVSGFFGGEIPAEIFRADGAEIKMYGVSTLPDSYLMHADGTLQLRFHGARNWRTAAARAMLREYADPR